jgi:hypothetical protein
VNLAITISEERITPGDTPHRRLSPLIPLARRLEAIAYRLGFIDAMQLRRLAST